jgi:hypothetical protein
MSFLGSALDVVGGALIPGYGVASTAVRLGNKATGGNLLKLGEKAAADVGHTIGTKAGEVKDWAVEHAGDVKDVAAKVGTGAAAVAAAMGEGTVLSGGILAPIAAPIAALAGGVAAGAAGVGAAAGGLESLKEHGIVDDPVKIRAAKAAAAKAAAAAKQRAGRRPTAGRTSYGPK